MEISPAWSDIFKQTKQRDGRMQVDGRWSGNTHIHTQTGWTNAATTDINKAMWRSRSLKLRALVKQLLTAQWDNGWCDLCQQSSRWVFSVWIPKMLSDQGEDRWAHCLMGPRLWCQEENEMISSPKLPPAEWLGPMCWWRRLQFGWSSVNRELHDLTLHDGVPMVGKLVWI